MSSSATSTSRSRWSSQAGSRYPEAPSRRQASGAVSEMDLKEVRASCLCYVPCACAWEYGREM